MVKYIFAYADVVRYHVYSDAQNYLFSEPKYQKFIATRDGPFHSKTKDDYNRENIVSGLLVVHEYDSLPVIFLEFE